MSKVIIYHIQYSLPYQPPAKDTRHPIALGEIETNRWAIAFLGVGYNRRQKLNGFAHAIATPNNSQLS
ncbi:hypothetical protein [Coleofasciculus sp. F4-SAH-05]|uniref:hypothetical protein n=1 Tax=Coleofasciculus sp. F4-SAH-05 TaxID=3069525 RepID=UPI003304B5CB